MRAAPSAPDNDNRLVNRVNLFWASLYLIVLSLWMSPLLLNWMLLVAQASMLFARSAWFQCLAFFSAPWQNIAFFSSNFWLLFKLSGINASFGYAALISASDHDDFCQAELFRTRARHRGTILLAFDTLVKCVTAVAATRYGILLMQTNQLYAQTPWLVVMGCGTLIQGLLGLRAKAITLCVEDRSNLSGLEISYREWIESIQALRQRCFGRSSTHVLCDIVIVTVIAAIIAPFFPYAYVWPIFYMVVAVQNTYQLFHYVIRDIMRVGYHWKQIILYRQIWNGRARAFIPCRSRFTGLLGTLGLVSSFGLCRAVIGYLCLSTYAGFQPIETVRAFLVVPSLLVHHRTLDFLWSLACFALPFTVAPMLMMLLNSSSLQKEDGTFVHLPWLQSVVIRHLSHAEDAPERQAKIEVIFRDFMSVLVLVLCLYAAFPMMPTLYGLKPTNPFIAGLAPLAVPVLTFSNHCLSSMFTKSYVDLNAENCSAWLRRRGCPEWVCVLSEQGVGIAFVVTNYCHRIPMIPHWMSSGVSHICHLFFRYTGLQFVFRMLAMVGQIIGLSVVWSGIRYALGHWWIFMPLRYSFAQMAPLMTFNAAVWFVTAWCAVNLLLTAQQCWMRVDWDALQRRFKPRIDSFSEWLFLGAALAFLITMFVSSVQLGLALSSGMSWQAASITYVLHVVSVLFVAAMIYVCFHVVPEYFRWLDARARENLALKPEGGQSSRPPINPSSVEPSAPPYASESDPLLPHARPVSSDEYAASRLLPSSRVDRSLGSSSDDENDIPVATEIDPLLDIEMTPIDPDLS